MIYVVVGYTHDWEGTFTTNFFASTKREVADAKVVQLTEEKLSSKGKLHQAIDEFEVEEVESD